MIPVASSGAAGLAIFQLTFCETGLLVSAGRGRTA
jgi:hypothetical protein